MKTITGRFCAIGVYHVKSEINIGTLVRSALILNAKFVFTIGKRYKKQSSSLRLERSIPILHYGDIDEWKKSMPQNASLVAVEINENSIPIKNFIHPKQAIYLLGAEDYGIPQELLDELQIIQLPGEACFNVATAGAIVLYDRFIRRNAGFGVANSRGWH